MRNFNIKTIRLFCVSFILFLATLHPANAAPTDPVTIPDSVLRTFIENRLGKNAGDTITEAEMNGMQGDLAASNRQIHDLTGLEHATGLNGIVVGNRDSGSFTRISNVEPLRGLTQLTRLELWGNDIMDISPLSGLTALTSLSLNRNYKIVDVSPLSGLTALTSLDLNRNRIVDIASLSRLTALTSLDLTRNRGLSDISVVANFVHLTNLWLSSTAITEAGLSAVLPSLSKLNSLTLAGTRISDLSVFNRLPQNVVLRSLDLGFMASDNTARLSTQRTDGPSLGWLLTDITPLVDFMKAGRIITGTGTNTITLTWNFALDYESLYTDIPALFDRGVSTVRYHPGTPGLQRESAEHHVGRPRTRHTFVVRAINVTTANAEYTNDRFAKVPVTWRVTAPNGRVTEKTVVTGDDGLARVSIILGNAGQTHTVDAVVPAKTTSRTDLQHGELRVRFTATADSNAPIAPDPTLSGLTVTFEDYPEDQPTDEFSLTIKFSESVTGFQAADIRVETRLTKGTGTATLKDLTPTTEPTQTYTAKVGLPTDAGGTVRLIVSAGAAVTTLGQIGPIADTASDLIRFGYPVEASNENIYPRRPAALAVTQIDFTKGSFSVQNTTQYRFNVEMRIYSEDHKDRWFKVSDRALIAIEDAETLTFSLTPVATDDPSIIHLNSELLLNQNQNQPLKLSAEKFSIKLIRGIVVDTVSNMNEDFRFKETRWTPPGEVIYRQYDAVWDKRLQGLRRDHLPYYRFPLDGQLADSWDVEASVPAVPPVSVDLPASTLPETSTLGPTLSILPTSVVSPPIGEQLVLHLNIEGGESVAGYQASVQFDTTALRYASSANGDYLPSGAFFVAPVVEGNLVKLNAASPVGEAHGNGTLATLTFEVIAVKASTLTLVDVLLSNAAGAVFVPQLENAQITKLITKPTRRKGDVNGDGTVNTADLVLIASNFGKTGQNAADVNSDGVVNIADFVLAAGALDTNTAAPSLFSQTVSTLTVTDVRLWLSQAQYLTLTDATSQRGLLFLEQLLAALTPKETALLPNYPNPFNPETWIPYHLAKDAEVTLDIYNVQGLLVRRLKLGHQAAGIYRSRARAAHWDGQNQLGEQVASGLYFYTFTADDFTATQKLLIRK